MLLFNTLIKETIASTGYPKISWKMFLAACEEEAIGRGANIYPIKGEEYSDCLFDTKQEAVLEWKECQSLFQWMPNPIVVYRFIKVNSADEIKLDAPGSHWTWSKDNWQFLANDVAEGNGKPFIISGSIAKQHIDWIRTLSYYASFTMNRGDEDIECEIFIPEENWKYLQDLKVEPYDN